MISASQLQAIRKKAAAVIESAFPVEIEIDGHRLPAARHRRTTNASHAMAGLLPTADVSWRVRREVLPPGITIRPERTVVTEDGQSFRVETLHDPAGDPCIVIQARAL